MNSTHSQIFQKNVTLTAAPNGHLWKEIDTTSGAASARMRTIQTGYGSSLGIRSFANEQFASPRRRKLKRPSSLISKEGHGGITKKELVTIVKQLFGDRLAINEAIAAPMVIA